MKIAGGGILAEACAPRIEELSQCQCLASPFLHGGSDIHPCDVDEMVATASV
jgi:hypothetical protein